VTPSVRPNGKCRRCRADLTEGRLFSCASCDATVDAFIARQKAERIESHIRHSNLPLAYRNGQRGFGDVTNRDGLALAKGVLAHEVRGMYLYGTAGIEKTTLACATMAALLKQDMGGRYENTLDLMMDINASYSVHSTVTRQEIVIPLINTPVLLLDDFGKEKGSEHSGGVIYQILDGRYNLLTVDSKRVLIIVSNHPPAAACARFGDATLADPILRRISELTVPCEMK
jgi:DNA replication protein DnaC